MTASANVQICNSWRSWQSEDGVVSETGHATCCHQKSGRNEGEGSIDYSALDHLSALNEVTDEDGEADYAHARQNATANYLGINLKCITKVKLSILRIYTSDWISL